MSSKQKKKKNQTSSYKKLGKFILALMMCEYTKKERKTAKIWQSAGKKG
jgi:hypothetical protein